MTDDQNITPATAPTTAAAATAPTTAAAATAPTFNLEQEFKDAQALADVQAAGFDDAWARIRQRRQEAPEPD